MMSADRAGVLLLLYVAGAFLCGVPASNAQWLVVSAVPWALAVASMPELPWGPAFAAWAAWLGWTGVCALVSAEPWFALAAWWRGASVLLILGLAAAWWGRRERRAWALALTALGLAGGGALLAARLGWPWPATLAASAGVWAAAGAAAGAGWLSGEDDGWSPFAWAALAAGAAAVCGLGGWPARLSLAAAGGWCALAGRRRSPGALALFAGVAAALAGLAGWRAWWPADAWSAALSVLLSHPVVGVGPGQLSRELSHAGWAAREARSLLLAVGAETGGFGLLLFGAAIAASVPAGFRRLDGAGRAAAAAFVALAAYAVLEDVPASPAFLATLAAAAAVALSADRIGQARASDRGAPLRLERWFTVLGLALALASALPRELLRRALAGAAAAPSREARIEALERAARLAPDDAAIQADLAREALLASPSRVAEALRRIELAAEADPANSLYRAQIAELWAAFGALDRAEAAARLALEREPRFVSPRLVLAEREAAQGRPERARAWLEEARAARAAGPGGAVSAWDPERETRILGLLPKGRAGRR